MAGSLLKKIEKGKKRNSSQKLSVVSSDITKPMIKFINSSQTSNNNLNH